jgi:hypothetical protein
MLRASRFTITALLVLASCAVQPALSQNRPLLDLTAAPAAPAPGSGAGTIALAESLGTDAAAIDKSTPDARVRAEVRLLARVLLTSGEKAGQSGSARIVMGRTLAHAIPHVDRLAAASADDPLLITAAADLAAARSDLEANADPDLVLRDSLAVLSRLAGPATGLGGWIDDHSTPPPAVLASKVDVWSSLPGITSESVAVLREVDAIAQASEPWPAYHASAARTRAIIADAATAFESPPSWLPDPSRRILGEQFSAAIVTLSNAELRVAAIDDLTRLAAIADLIRRTDTLEDNPPGKRIRAGVAQAVAIPASQTDARTMESYTQLLSLISARVNWPEDKQLIRQLRPGYRLMVAAARQTELHVLAALPDVLRRPEAMTDPGTLSSITAHRRAIADVAGLLAVNRAFAAIGEGEPVADKPWQAAANRVLKLTQDLSRADQKELALASLRSLFTHVDQLGRLAGEDQLRQAVKDDAGKPAKDRTSMWAKLSGGRDAALASEITDRRAGWLFDWEKGIAGGSDGQRLEVLAAVLALIEDAGPVVDPGEAYSALQAWPGWELSPAALAVVSAGLPDQTAEATRQLLAGDSAKAAEAVAKARKEFAVALLAGRLASEAQRRGITPDRSAASTLRELTSGGPIRGRSWLGRHTELLDDVCRYSEEIAALRKLGAKDKADAVQKFANSRAVEALDGVEDNANR